MTTRRTSLVLLLGTLLATRSHAVVTGAIFGPGSEALPIAVVPLKNQGGDSNGVVGTRFARVLTRDLELSGYFKLIDPKTFIENPQSSGITAGDVDFVGWAAIGAQALVKGGVTMTGDTATVEVRLFDVPGRHDVPPASRRFSGGQGDVPRMAHRTADAILEYLTGERGPFDSQIALVSAREGRLKDIYRFTFDLDDPVRITDQRSLVVNPRWRPDARAILFTSYRDHAPHLFQVELPAQRVMRLAVGPLPVLDGAWSPDGSKLLVTRVEDGNPDIYLLDRGGQVMHRLTDHWGIDVSPVWAPDGRRLAFCSSRSGAPQIYVMHVDGSGAERVSRSGSYNTSPAWSPKGDRLAWVTRANGGLQVVIAAADGAGAHTITSDGNNENPSWGPDGRYLVFSSQRGGHAHLIFTDRDGKTQKQLTRGAGDDTSPAWSPRLE